jgi:hypothetical protein
MVKGFTFYKCVIAKNCTRYSADTHSVSVQFCGNLPLLFVFAYTRYYNLQRSYTAVDPHVGA